MLLLAASAVEIEDNDSEFGLSKSPASRTTDRNRSARASRKVIPSDHFFRELDGFHSPIYYLSVDAGKIAQGLVPLTLFGFLSLITTPNPPSRFQRTWGTRGPPLTA